MDHVEEYRSEGLLHVRTNPDEKPVVELYASGKDSADARASADGNATAEEVGEVRKTGKLKMQK